MLARRGGRFAEHRRNLAATNLAIAEVLAAKRRVPCALSISIYGFKCIRKELGGSGGGGPKGSTRKSKSKGKGKKWKGDATAAAAGPPSMDLCIFDINLYNVFLGKSKGQLLYVVCTKCCR